MIDLPTSWNDIASKHPLLEVLCNDPELFIGVTTVDSDQFLFVNQTGIKMFQYAKTESLINRSWQDLLKKPLSMEESLEISEQIKNHKIWSAEVELKAENGELFWGYLHISGFRVQSKTYGLIKIRNINTYKTVENKLLLEKQRFEALFQYATMGILVTNKKGRIIMANQFAKKEFRYEDSTLIGKSVEELIPKRFHQEHHHDRNNYYHEAETRPMGAGRDLFGLRKDGSEFPVEISLSPFQTGEGLFVIAFIIDITVRKEKEHAERMHREEIAQANEEIQKLNNMLEAKVASRTRQLEETLNELKLSRDEILNSLSKEKELIDMKSRFVSLASHEFRTPLSTILSSASLLAKYPLTEEQPKREKHVERIKSSVQNLTGILNEFLSIGRIENGRMEVHYTELNLEAFINTVITEMEDIKRSRQHVTYVHEGMAQVQMDQNLLRNILINLISNAIKFSHEEGLIEINSRRIKDSMIISIKDHGMGISAEDQKHLFERFFRGKNILNIQGTGLGLYIVGKYVQLMNGSISFKSELNKGTEFILNFRL